MFVGGRGIHLLYASFLFFYLHLLMRGYYLPLVQFRLEQSKLEKLESRKRVKASLEARTGVVKPLVKSSYTSALKQVKGGQPPHAKLSCKLNVNL